MNHPHYMTEGEVATDLERLSQANHRNMTVVQVPGGWRLRCLSCKIEGRRLYQDRGEALNISIRLALAENLPECSFAAPTAA